MGIGKIRGEKWKGRKGFSPERYFDTAGFIPCPDHRIAPDAKWENVQYYCEQMKKIYK